MQLQQRVALITGGGSGIGRATAVLFAREGARVMITGRRRDALQAVVTDITAAGGCAAFRVADIADATQVRSLIDETLRQFGRIDILSNNAGTFMRGKEAHEFTEAEWRRIYDINFNGTMLCSTHAIPHMKERGGVIINCTSVSGRVPQRGQAPYNVSKAAVEMMSKCMALELGKYRIRVNTICPSMTDTEMAAPYLVGASRQATADAHPIQRIGTPEEMAQAALYLASDAASWISGNSLHVDGGYSCR
jgi:NAD(P)-dependent dehydrogenase (short-subunit alcohol dehydrogenase family)